MEHLSPCSSEEKRRSAMVLGWRDKGSFEEDNWGCWRARLACTVLSERADTLVSHSGQGSCLIVSVYFIISKVSAIAHEQKTSLPPITWKSLARCS